MAFQRVYRFLVWKTEYICITQLRSIDLPATRSLLPSSVPLLSCSFFILLLVNFRCLSSFSFVCSSKHFLFVSFFFYHLFTFSSFFFLSNYLSLRSIFCRSIFISPFIFSCTFPAFSSSHPFLWSLYPSFCLSYSSFFVCFRSLSFFCISSSIFYSLFLWFLPARNRGFSFDILKNSFRILFIDISNFRYLFFSIAFYALYLIFFFLFNFIFSSSWLSIFFSISFSYISSIFFCNHLLFSFFFCYFASNFPIFSFYFTLYVSLSFYTLFFRLFYCKIF